MAEPITSKTVLIIIFYGLLPIGTGLDDLGREIKSNNKNITVEFSSCYGWETKSSKWIRRSLTQKIILVGHSCGAWSAIGTANELALRDVPVALLVAFDPPFTIGTIPSNVDLAIGYRQKNGSIVGAELKPAHNNQVSIVINIPSDEGHVSIAANKRYHRQILNDIRRITSQ